MTAVSIWLLIRSLARGEQRQSDIVSEAERFIQWSSTLNRYVFGETGQTIVRGDWFSSSRIFLLQKCFTASHAVCNKERVADKTDLDE